MIEIQIINTIRYGFTIGFEYFDKDKINDFYTINIRLGMVQINVNIR